ncbi:M1 family metallopeptidase [Nocardioides albidus]|uniref:Aminopeptidase N n=1 Tax=Nocardioides albidus TaxID=1517589 RepID=A0A5C4WPC8_9ACTN|nr:M1 family metallopeptidase [Nocardioides albidus]TNM50144.1 M1 family metallopeptidase [Nocardioides albidus]
MKKAVEVLGAAMGCLALAACAGQTSGGDAGPGRSSASPTSSPVNPPDAGAPAGDLAIARNDTREDSVYPEIGDPLVDALHYDLDLAWAPDADRLTARETLTFRATGDAPRIPLDFNEQLAISSATVDGTPAEVTVEGNDLTVAHPIAADQRYELVLEYAGTPAPAPAPSQRADFTQGVGWSITPEHETWTLQEPYGAFTWYAVNDHPSDKALYDFTLTAPAPMSGVANGVLASSTAENGRSVNTWHLAEPASSYLVTVAFGDFQHTDLESASGVPIQIWTDADGDPTPGETASAPDAIDWLEKVLGPYPFDSFGLLVVDNESGMETQTMVTLGDTAYSLSEAVIVHEAAHHWYGDTVTPADWSDVWMNEGMAMYLQGMWESEQEGVPVVGKMDEWASFEADLRTRSGPPGAFDPTRFGDGNIYYGPALMWQELRERVGDERFFELLREWPSREANGTADRREYLDWIEATTGEELSSFFDDWLLDETTPERD